MTVGDPDLPTEFDGLRIALVSDQHVGPIGIAGTHDETGRGPDAPNLDAALRGVSGDTFTMLAAHQPKAAESARGKGVDLQPSGHTRGGLRAT